MLHSIPQVTSILNLIFIISVLLFVDLPHTFFCNHSISSLKLLYIFAIALTLFVAFWILSLDLTSDFSKSHNLCLIFCLTCPLSVWFLLLNFLFLEVPFVSLQSVFFFYFNRLSLRSHIYNSLSFLKICLACFLFFCPA